MDKLDSQRLETFPEQNVFGTENAGFPILTAGLSDELQGLFFGKLTFMNVIFPHFYRSSR
jgi:hypothetical protein